ncbi:MAG: ATP phosphoribosyltransferase regulatory subunit, partial [Candidatus Magnetominusculus sp. LBB02]|nr:ATP phosphoribosyltransferase regulatory subunit [Candidatus Magnetominusculus sp. LBB02]
EADAEMLYMINEFFNKLHVTDLSLEINSIGCKQCRPAYKSALFEFYSQKEDALCKDCYERLDKNPLRILDCKVDGCVELRKGAPAISDYLCEQCKSHHDRLKELLTNMGISFHDNPLIVRGLDYYTKTTFEFTTEHLGAQNAVAAGGRYDDLVEEFGGRSTSAIGFASGIERLADLMRMKTLLPDNRPFFYFAALGEKAWRFAISLAVKIMHENIPVKCGEGQMSLKSHMKRADSLNAKYVVMFGENEIVSDKAAWKCLSDHTQGEISLKNIDAFIELHKRSGHD